MDTVTGSELTGLVDLAHRRGVRHIAIGSGRTPEALAFVDQFTSRWERTGGEVTETITWPEEAASWLHQATRFMGAGADLWVMTGPALGWAQMTRRLLWSTTWRPEHALVTAAVSTPEALRMIGLHNLDGLTGVNSQGVTWTIHDGRQVWPPHPTRHARHRRARRGRP
ncbi:hypothetical protein ABI214_00020 [Prescottella soli]|uniref:Uncharacterized protein n=1 Tax=Prescottella soli TaxID=1543852 RepID=A0ABW9G0Y8_9NOCA